MNEIPNSESLKPAQEVIQTSEVNSPTLLSLFFQVHVSYYKRNA